MRRIALLGMVALAAWAAPGAMAQKGRVALLPPHVFQGDPQNGPLVMDALRENLEKQGFDLVPEAKVENALRSLGVNLKWPQSINTMRRLRSATGADYVVYPRVLGVGMGIKAVNPQVNLFVNVLGKRGGGYIHSWQVGQEFKPKDNPENLGALVIDPETADRAASRVLSGFYARVK